MEKERIIWTVEQLREGDVTSKDYQKRLFDTFVKAVYLWDDKIEVHYYYSGEKNVLTSSLKGAAEGGGSDLGGVLINSPTGHQNQNGRTPFKSAILRYIEAHSVSYSIHRGTMPDSATQIVLPPMQLFKNG